LINLIQIAWRFLIGRHSSGLISFSFYLSIIGLAIGTASLLLISAFSNGFAEKVQSKLATIDGDIRIEKYSPNSNSKISLTEFDELNSIIQSVDGINSFFKYYQTQAMLQTGQQSEGTLLFGVNDNLLFDLTSLSKIEFLNDDINQNEIVLGAKLADNLGLQLGEKVNLFDLNLLTNNQQIKGINLTVVGLINTGFPEYDKMVSFVSDETYKNFYESSEFINGIILDINNQNFKLIVENLQEVIDFPFIVNTWQDRHSVLLQWMSIYHIPIQLVMGFITLLAIFNISSTLWMISLDKVGNVGILKTLGYSKQQVRNIFLLKGCIVGILGIIIGTIISGIVYFLQTNFQLISLSSEVYFLEYLPISPIIFESFLIIVGIFFATMMFSLIPAINVKNAMPAQVLKEN